MSTGKCLADGMALREHSVCSSEELAKASRLPGWLIWFSHRRPASCWYNTDVNNSLHTDRHNSCFCSELRGTHVWEEVKSHQLPGIKPRISGLSSLGPAALLLCELEPNTMSLLGLYFLVDLHPVSLTPTFMVFFLPFSQSSSCTSKAVCSSWGGVWTR